MALVLSQKKIEHFVRANASSLLVRVFFIDCAQNIID